MKTITRFYKSSKTKTSLLRALCVSIIAISLFSYSSCTVSLAPRFDQNIVDELSTSSVDVFGLLAEVADGVSKESFDKRSDEYNSVIGRLDALELQIEARPMPENKVLEKIMSKVNKKLQDKGLATISATDTAPSATAVKNIMANITQMKAADKHEGLNMLTVKTFRGDIQLYLDQAITYESYLNR